MKGLQLRLKLFRTQPSYWDLSALSMIRDAAESLLERIEEAQEEKSRFWSHSGREFIDISIDVNTFQCISCLFA